MKNSTKQRAGIRWTGLLGLFGVRSTGFSNRNTDTPEPPEYKEPKAPEPPKWVEGWNKLAKQYPIGSYVEYLGIKMMVVNNGEAYSFQNPFFDCDVWEWHHPEMICEYVDNHGIIQRKKFADAEAMNCLPNG
jgi:hypothetical protein